MATPRTPKGARTGRLLFGSVGLAGSAAIVLAMGPVWTQRPVNPEVLATPMRAAEQAEILAAADTRTVTPPTTAPPSPTTVAPAPELIIVEVHRRRAGDPTGSTDQMPVVADPGSPVTGAASPAPAPAQGSGLSPAAAAAPTPAPAPAAPTPAPAPAPQAAPAPAPPPPPPAAPTPPPRTSSSG